MSNYADADLATDDAAYRAAQAAVRQAERARYDRYLQEKAEREQAEEDALRRNLADRYPSPFPDRVYDMAERLAHHDMDTDVITDDEMDAAYAEIVDLINAVRS